MTKVRMADPSVPARLDMISLLSCLLDAWVSLASIGITPFLIDSSLT